MMIRIESFNLRLIAFLLSCKEAIHYYYYFDKEHTVGMTVFMQLYMVMVSSLHLVVGLAIQSDPIALSRSNTITPSLGYEFVGPVACRAR